MAITITISGTPIEMPTSGTDPNWANAMVAFALAVEAALQNVSGAFDVSPQVLNIDAQNPGTNIDITALSFPTSEVRSVFLSYAVFRQTTTTTVSETGELRFNYNPDGPINSKWEKNRDYQGDAKISFSISDTGQVSYTTTAIAGANHTGAITFAAKALLQTS